MFIQGKFVGLLIQASIGFCWILEMSPIICWIAPVAYQNFTQNNTFKCYKFYI